MKVATDIGGTFTDLVYVDEKGKIGTAKSHTTPHSFDEGVINVINESGINTEAMDMFIHGSTVIINALIQRDGVKTGLITTKRSEEHTSELQSRFDLVCRLLLPLTQTSKLFPYTTLFRSRKEKLEQRKVIRPLIVLTKVL